MMLSKRSGGRSADSDIVHCIVLFTRNSPMVYIREYLMHTVPTRGSVMKHVKLVLLSCAVLDNWCRTSVQKVKHSGDGFITTNRLF